MKHHDVQVSHFSKRTKLRRSMLNSMPNLIAHALLKSEVSGGIVLAT